MQMRRLDRLGGLACVLALGLASARGQDEGEGKVRLGMTTAVAGARVGGYEQYEPLDEPALTADEKLLVYYRPRNFGVERVEGGMYRAHLTEDGRIRRRGKKEVVWSKDK